MVTSTQCQAERLADETDCWLHIATSHPSVKGECYQWMSPTMEDDLPPDVCDHLIKQTVKLFSTLKKVRRHDVAAVEMEATQYRTERDDAVRARDEAQGLADQRQAIIDRLGEHMRTQGLDITQFLEGSPP
ncbi:hypothetical protein PQX77_015724 [Marasmius sp. AFHP31]|nr:hypothetical protein PQX77_015724 [Marasmius sp. AFHP31]